MKIGFTGATGCVDFGDYAMLANNIHQILELSPSAEFCVFTYNHANTQAALSANGVLKHCSIVEDVLAVMGEAYGNVPNSALKKENITAINQKWKSLFYACVDRNIPTELSSLLSALESCDVLLFNGGGYLNKNWLFRVYAFLVIILLARHVGTRVVMLPQTYGPFAKETQAEVGYAFQLVDLFYCRDRIFSEAVLRSLNVNDAKIHFAIDDLFLLSKPLAAADLWVPEDALFVQLHKQMRSQIPNLIKGVALLIENMYRDGLIKEVVFVVFHHSGDNELSIAQEIIGELPDMIPFSVRGPDWNAGNLIGGFSDAKAVLCSRYHPLVIALRQQTPVVNLLAADNTGSYEYYSAKNYGICEYVGVDKRQYCVDSEVTDVLLAAEHMLRSQLDGDTPNEISEFEEIQRERVDLWNQVIHGGEND